MRDGSERPSDKRLLRHIERQIDWYQMKEYKPTHDYWRKRLRETNALVRRINRLVAMASPPEPHPPEEGDKGE
jgi:hypothetical protein